MSKVTQQTNGKAELTATVTSGDKTASRKWELSIKPQEKSVAMTITEVKQQA